jgi:hypothetical protein
MASPIVSPDNRDLQNHIVAERFDFAARYAALPLTSNRG